MGFSLQISAISQMVSSEEDERALRELLQRNNIAFRDRFDPAGFQNPIFEVETFEDDEEESEEAAYVAHLEVGWSWWAKVQEYVQGLLRERPLQTLAIHAWYGVAVPGDVEPTLLGKPEPRILPPRKPGLLERLGLQGRTEREVNSVMDGIVMAYGGENVNLHVVSGTRLLEELEAAIRAAGLQDADPFELYENVDDDEPTSVASCYLVMVHTFLKAGIDQGHLVWWRK